jgi:phosphatidylglycerophosphate synthase
MNNVAQHARHQRSLLAGPERAVLDTLAQRMPLRVNPDHLTGIGAIGMVMAGAAYAAAPWEARSLFAVAIALAVNWFGDSLDGTLARARRCPRPRYGYYLDHVIDTAGSILIVGGLALSGLITPILAMGVLVAYLAVSAETYLATHAVGVFRMSYAGFGPTELRILLGAGSIAAYFNPVVSLGPLGTFLLFDVGGVAATMALAITFAYSAISRSRELYRAEPLPRTNDLFGVEGRTPCASPTR